MGAKPTKAHLWQRNWLPRDIYFKKCITKPCQIHQNESNTFSKLCLCLACWNDFFYDFKR